ncbi:MAG TPA: Ig-like domain-containing protein [Mycobacteriales bacterium]
MGRGVARVRVAGGGRRGFTAAAAVLLLALVAGCSGDGASSTGDGSAFGLGNGGSSTPAVTTRPAPPAAVLSFSPRNGSTGASVTKPVVVTAKLGTLVAVTVRNADGGSVGGALNASRTRWTSAEPLGYEKSYSVNATARGADGRTVTGASSFRTVEPRTFTLPYLFPGPGGPKTVGVGQPIYVRFDEPISDRAAAEKALTVTTTPHVDGAWHWFSDQIVHWRPRTYWTPGTKVTVKAAVYGVHVGDDVYGQEDVTSSFTIGPARIFTINDRTHTGVITVNGKVVKASVPVSMGRGGKTVVDGKAIYFTTQSGPHIVAEKYPVKQMKSESYGLPKDSPLGYDEKIPLAVRISPDGEFVHAASWSVADQGVRNVSHGCVNISPDNARWFYGTFSYGDIVDIRNTGVDLPFAPGYNEWKVSWATWLEGSALN